jgi:general secretion pathway protein B
LREARKLAPALAASPPAPAAAAPDRLLSVNELPADVQRDLPKLAISGGVYSDNPAQRMLIVNGQVVGEGAEPAPGVVLELIRAKTAVLRYRGYRYAVAY